MLRELRTAQEQNLFQFQEVFGIYAEGLPAEENFNGFVRVLRPRLFLSHFARWRAVKALFIAEWLLRGCWRYTFQSRRDVIQCHSLPALIIGFFAKVFRGSKIIYDAHELETETIMMGGTRKKVYRWLERKLIPFADQVMVVTPSIEAWYRRTYGPLPITTVLNIPDPKKQVTAPRNLKGELNLPAEAVLFLYLGVMTRGRGIDLMAEAFKDIASDKHILFVGYGPLTEKLITMASTYKNIHVLPAVKPDEVSSITASADVGVSLIEDLCLSYHYSLPNKVFEYLHGDIPVLVSDLPEMSALIDKYACGWKLPLDARQVKLKIESIRLEDVHQAKKNIKAVLTKFSWSEEEEKLVRIYKNVFKE